MCVDEIEREHMIIITLKENQKSAVFFGENINNQFLKLKAKSSLCYAK